MAAGWRGFTLCADDYGLGEPVDAGIRQLLWLGRLGAVSCLVESPRWPEAAQALQPFLGSVDIGLHLNLTQAFPGQPAWPLPGLILRAYLRQLPPALLEARISAQIERFRAGLGRLPDYIDGHQHVQQLPQVRDALLRQLARHWRRAPPWVRVALPQRWRGLKAGVIAALGAATLARQLQAQGLACNPDFAGIYELQPAAGFRHLMQGWLRELGSDGVIMCHPGEAGDAGESAGDPVAAARVQELEYLASPAFLRDCRRAQRNQQRFSQKGLLLSGLPEDGLV